MVVKIYEDRVLIFLLTVTSHLRLSRLRRCGISIVAVHSPRVLGIESIPTFQGFLLLSISHKYG